MVESLVSVLASVLEAGVAGNSAFLYPGAMAFVEGPEIRAAAAIKFSRASLESTSRVAFGPFGIVQPPEPLSVSSATVSLAFGKLDLGA